MLGETPVEEGQALLVGFVQEPGKTTPFTMVVDLPPPLRTVRDLWLDRREGQRFVDSLNASDLVDNHILRVGPFRWAERSLFTALSRLFLLSL